jgi:hypothetical protein
LRAPKCKEKIGAIYPGQILMNVVFNPQLSIAAAIEKQFHSCRALTSATRPLKLPNPQPAGMRKAGRDVSTPSNLLSFLDPHPAAGFVERPDIANQVRRSALAQSPKPALSASHCAVRNSGTQLVHNRRSHVWVCTDHHSRLPGYSRNQICAWKRDMKEKSQ